MQGILQQAMSASRLRRCAAAWARLECHAQGFGGLQADAKTARLKAAVDAGGGVWRDCTAMTEAALAELVRSDKVDVLVELTGGRSCFLGGRQPPHHCEDAGRIALVVSACLRRVRSAAFSAQCTPEPAADMHPCRPHRQQPPGRDGAPACPCASHLDRLRQQHGHEPRRLPLHGCHL